MRKIIFCAVVAIAMLTFVSCGKQETVKNQVVGDIYAEQVEGGFQLVKQYGEQYSPVAEEVFSKITYEKALDLVLAYQGSSFQVFAPDGYKRGEGAFDSYDAQGEIVLFKDGAKTMVYSKKGVVIGTFTNGDFVIEKNFIFTKNPKGWSLRNLDGDYLTDISYNQIYIIDMKDDGSYDKLCYRDGVWSMTGSDGGIYDKSSTEDLVKKLKKKNPTEPVGVLDI